MNQEQQEYIIGINNLINKAKIEEIKAVFSFNKEKHVYDINIDGFNKSIIIKNNYLNELLTNSINLILNGNYVKGDDDAIFKLNNQELRINESLINYDNKIILKQERKFFLSINDSLDEFLNKNSLEKYKHEIIVFTNN